jgi:hypothetical protein
MPFMHCAYSDKKEDGTQFKKMNSEDAKDLLFKRMNGTSLENNCTSTSSHGFYYDKNGVLIGTQKALADDLLDK